VVAAPFSSMSWMSQFISAISSKLMSVAIKVAPRTAIRFVQRQMSKRLSAPRTPTAV
jgi:c-di-GMP-binding flagellar brake protein YcgR